MSDHPRSILFAGTDLPLFKHVADAVRAMGITTDQVPWNGAVCELVAVRHFDVVVAGYPLPGAELGRFLSTLRAQQSPCRSAGLVLVAALGTVEEATLLIGRGVSRVLSERSPPDVLVLTLGELLAVAPRVPVKTTAWVRAAVERGPQSALYQTENLSDSGMLLRGWSHLTVGTGFSFELNIPGQEEPIRGQATVTRVTDAQRESFAGIGARFDLFAAADHDRLSDFLAARVN